MPEADTRSTVSAPISPRRIYVESEFASLHTVVLAQSEMRLPDADTFSPAQLDEEIDIMPADKRLVIRELLGKDHAIAMPARQAQWECERANFQAVLEKHDIEVLRPRLLTQYEKDAGGANGYANAFVRDPWFTVGGHVIEGSLRFPHRRREVLASRNIMKTQVIPAGSTYNALPQPEIMPLEIDDGGPGPFLEGGDVLVHGQHIFVGQSGRASTAQGAEYLRKLLEPAGYTVEVVPLKPNILHLDCAMGMVREGLLVVYEEGVLNGVPESLADWEKIPVSQLEAANLGTNGLPISPTVYITDPFFERIGSEVAKRGIHVEYVDFAISRGFGGAFRCSTQPLWRETP
ncbi:dimethylarginine dimethylaminohydrolase family protein [Subtercola vilae]|uniref:Amidinotransferase n=1 Tax=Subtercola vilae TaxID=2056433 RepID=A0A4T2BC16_9MICO|nr:arginine deiminase family protein [Subtercola vilae]TIH27021.1 amidinotransferase [Subtercola vilae]